MKVVLLLATLLALAVANTETQLNTSEERCVQRLTSMIQNICLNEVCVDDTIGDHHDLFSADESLDRYPAYSGPSEEVIGLAAVECCATRCTISQIKSTCCAPPTSKLR